MSFYFFSFDCAGSLLLRGLLIAVASIVECRLQAHGLGGSRHQSRGSIVVTHGLGCSKACGIFLDQGSNSWVLHQQVDSLPLSHWGGPLAAYSLDKEAHDDDACFLGLS